MHVMPRERHFNDGNIGLYTLQNNLLFIALQNLDGTYVVVAGAVLLDWPPIVVR